MSEMKTIRRKVIFANKLYMKFKVLIIYALTQHNTVRIYEMYKNNLTV